MESDQQCAIESTKLEQQDSIATLKENQEKALEEMKKENKE